MCADGLEIVDEIELEVTCMGCGQRIDTPKQADIELFRLGYRVHNDNDCYNLMITNLGVGPVFSTYANKM